PVAAAEQAEHAGLVELAARQLPHLLDELIANRADIAVARAAAGAEEDALLLELLAPLEIRLGPRDVEVLAPGRRPEARDAVKRQDEIGDHGGRLSRPLRTAGCFGPCP